MLGLGQRGLLDTGAAIVVAVASPPNHHIIHSALHEVYHVAFGVRVNMRAPRFSLYARLDLTPLGNSRRTVRSFMSGCTTPPQAPVKLIRIMTDDGDTTTGPERSLVPVTGHTSALLLASLNPRRQHVVSSSVSLPLHVGLLPSLELNSQ